jgi:ABC-type amino acid transport substrate-binding protein
VAEARPSRRRTGAALLACAGVFACTAPADNEATAVPGAVPERPVESPTQPIAALTFGDAREAGSAELVFVFVPSPGFAQRGADGRPTGVTVELLRDFAAYVAATHDIALTIRWLEQPRWSDFYAFVRDSNGGVFGVGNVTITAARRNELDFSPPYLDNVAVLVTHERVPELPALDRIGTAFGGLTALPFTGTLHEARLEDIRARWLPDMPVRPVTSDDELIALLASDGAYVAYTDVHNYWRARDAGAPLRRHAVGDDAAETFGVIMPHDSDWTPVMREFFAADGGYVRGARFRDHLRQHLGDELAALLGG